MTSRPRSHSQPIRTPSSSDAELLDRTSNAQATRRVQDTAAPAVQCRPCCISDGIGLEHMMHRARHPPTTHTRISICRECTLSEPFHRTDSSLPQKPTQATIRHYYSPRLLALETETLCVLVPAVVTAPSRALQTAACPWPRRSRRKISSERHAPMSPDRSTALDALSSGERDRFAPR
ncbi:hypothetical protein BV25DRAFT_332171 [Artomyces pyxidatus]|uniref:Uncharacterized protein n=1 Tax=Artomyces pyxidatus TaxID=48021 RepID=A0ACB8T6B1_9AGAM|nr:hypothetical protein BV25DRAFT_332171 [Artomyces pyxidatus]